MPPLAVSPRDYIHPDDYAALENLKQVPLFDTCLKAILKLAPERYFHGKNIADKIRLGPQQLPHLHRHLPVACEVLGIAEPELYLEMNPFPNAYTIGDTRPFISITSSLVELLTEHELRAVISHECGHIACRHVLYHTMAQMLLQGGASLLGPLAAAAAPLKLALLHWYRRSELSCDRAAAIVVGGPRPVVETMIRLAGGPKSVTGQVNIKQYLKQAQDYDQLLESTWDKLLQGLAASEMDHPWPAVRARAIAEWCRTEPYRKIVAALNGTKPPDCPSCHQVIHADWKFCKHCGTVIGEPLPPVIEPAPPA